MKIRIIQTVKFTDFDFNQVSSVASPVYENGDDCKRARGSLKLAKKKNEEIEEDIKKRSNLYVNH